MNELLMRWLIRYPAGFAAPWIFSPGGWTKPSTFGKRPVEAVENPVELDPHLQRQRPARDVIRRNRRASGITHVVGMILRLEHIEHVRAKRLGGLHDKGTGRIALARNFKLGGRPQHCDPGLQQRVYKFDCGRKIILIRGNDVAARIAIPRIMQDRVIQ